MEFEKLLARINALAKKEKESGLTPEEKELQQKLRKEYIATFRSGLEQRLDNIVLVDPDGNERPLQRKDKK